MYIEKLSEGEIKQIVKDLVLIAENGNIDRVESLLSGAKVRNGMGAVGVVFDTGYMMQHCTLSDYDAFVSYGHVKTEKEITVKFRKFMFNKFGEKYLKDMKQYYKKSIDDKYYKELKELYDELNEINKELNEIVK